MKYRVNAVTGQLDLTLDKDELDGVYVFKIGDTMTGELIINPTSGNTSLTAKKNIVVKAGQKIYFDGA